MSLLVDIGRLSCCASDHALEGMAKALTGGDGDDDGIWGEHESPFIRELVEQFSRRGLLAIESVRRELLAFLAGDRYNSAEAAMRPVPEGFMARWSQRELAVARLFLESLPVGQYRLDDYGLLVDFLVQRYLPGDVLRSEAEALAVRASMMGRVQANVEKLSAAQAGIIVGALPGSYEQVANQFSPSRAQAAALDYARVHACEQVTAMSDAMRHKLRQTVVTQVAGRVGTGPLPSALQSALHDDFSQLNRDWRRIAITEAGDAANNGLLASLKPGTRLRRVEVYKGACDFCRRIDGREMELVDAAAPNKDGQTQVWVGKSNVGRSFAPRKRVGLRLVERDEHELAWVTAGPAHPHCRGQWHVVQAARKGDDPEFAKWLAENL